MRLKLKILKISTGSPVIFLHESSAKKMGLHTGDRATVKNNANSLVAVVDIVRGFIKKTEAALSQELISLMKGHNGYVDVDLSSSAESSSILQNREERNQYSQKDFEKIMNDIINNRLTEVEIAYFISSMVHHKSSTKEVIYLINAIVKTGVCISWPYKKIADKHSI